MIYGIIIVLCIVGILVIFVRKLPVLSKFNFSKIKDQVKVEKKAETKVIDKQESPQVKQEKNNFSFFKQQGNKQNELFMKAERLFNDKRYSEAEEIIIRLIAKEPQNVKYYNRLGVIYMEEKNFHDAKNAFYEAIKLDPKKASRHYNYAIACADLGEFRNAVESLKKSISLDKKNKKYKKMLEDLQSKIKYRYEEMKRTDD